MASESDELESSSSNNIVMQFHSSDLSNFIVPNEGLRIGAGDTTLTHDFVAEKLLASLAHVHSKGVVHNDVKVEHLLIDDAEQQNDPTAEVKIRLTDFGLSKYTYFKNNQRIGTHAYASPQALLLEKDAVSFESVAREALKEENASARTPSVTSADTQEFQRTNSRAKPESKAIDPDTGLPVDFESRPIVYTSEVKKLDLTKLKETARNSINEVTKRDKTATETINRKTDALVGRRCLVRRVHRQVPIPLARRCVQRKVVQLLRKRDGRCDAATRCASAKQQ